jgi:hypothetical protein
MNIHKPIQLLIMAAFIAACGGGGGGDGNGGQSPNIGGVWTGTFTNNIYLCIIFVCVLDHTDTRPAMVLAAPDRRFHLIPWDVFSLSGLQPYEQTQYVGRLQVSGNAVSGRLDRVGATCLDNTGTGEFVRDQAIIDASVATGVALDGDWELDRCIGDGVFNLDYDTASSEPASLAAVSGLWLGGDLAIHIDNNGTVTGSNSSGCQFAGSVAPVDPAINIYEFEIAINNCPSLSGPLGRAPLDGPFDGLGAILPNSTGGRILIVSLSHQNQSATMVLDQ